MLELGTVGLVQVLKGCVLFSESGAIFRKCQWQDIESVRGG